MSDRNWRKHVPTIVALFATLIGCVAIWLAAWTYLSYENYEKQRAAAYERQIEQQDILTLLADPQKQKVAAEQRERAQIKREQSDLNAQWTAARWSAIQGIVGILALIALIATVFYAAKTWGEAKRAADLTETELRELRVAATAQLKNASEQLEAARDAVLATREGADASLDIQRKQSRAYMVVVSATYYPFKTQDDVYKQVAPDGHIRITIKNIGQTAAKKVIVRAAVSPANAASFEWEELNYAWPHRLSNIAPGQESEAVCLPQENIFVAMVPNLPMQYGVLRGEIRYTDVFDKRFRTCFIFWAYRGQKEGVESSKMHLQEAVVPAFEEIEPDPLKD